MLGSEAYVVSEVHGVGSIRVGKVRRLIEPEGMPDSSIWKVRQGCRRVRVHRGDRPTPLVFALA